MNESERPDLDDAIDRAAQQLVMHEPSPRLYAAVMARIEAGSSKSSASDLRRTASPYPTWRWAVAGMSAAALVAASLIVWQWQTQPQTPPVLPTLPAPPQMARIQPPDALATAAPQAPSRSPAPSSARRPAARFDEAQPANAPGGIQVDTIPVADISVAGIPVSTISIRDIDGNDPIPISTIDADGADAR